MAISLRTTGISANGSGLTLLFLQNLTGSRQLGYGPFTDPLGRTGGILFDNVAMGRSTGEVPDNCCQNGRAPLWRFLTDSHFQTCLRVLGYSLGGMVRASNGEDRPIDLSDA